MEQEYSDEIVKALKQSIDEKWIGIVRGLGIDKGSEDCPLCLAVEDRNKARLDLSDCFGCPIKDKSGESGCANTPFVAWRKHFTLRHPLYQGLKRVICSECEELAFQFLTYLKDTYKEITTEKKEYFLAAEQVSIGSEPIRIRAVSRNGDPVECGIVAIINIDGTLSRPSCVNTNIGLQLDKNGQIVVSD